MKECERINDLFGELHDGCDPHIAAPAHEHLRACAGCSEEFKWYGFTVRALAHLEDVTPPADFMQQLDARLNPAPFSLFDYFRNLAQSAPYFPLPVGVSALAVVIALGVLTVKPWSTQTQLTTTEKAASPSKLTEVVKNPNMVVRVVNNSNDARTHIMYIIDQMGVSPKRKPTGDLEFELPVNAFDKFSTMIQPVAATVGKPAVAGGNSHVVVQVQFPQY